MFIRVLYIQKTQSGLNCHHTNINELNLDELELISGGWNWKRAIIGGAIIGAVMGTIGTCIGGPPLGAVTGTVGAVAGGVAYGLS